MVVSVAASLPQLGVLLLALTTLPCYPYPTFTRPGVPLNHSALNPMTGTLYLGGVNRLYQLTGGLELVSEGRTGPVNDSRDCVPPIQPTNCPQARPIAVHNKLLLVDQGGGALLVCGSAHQGVCEKRALTDVAQAPEREAQPGEMQYVAADDASTATVGLVGRLGAGGRRALFVGRGYTHRATDAPITTRSLDGAHPFSNDEMGRLAVGAFADYDHRFAAAFAHDGYVYFLFNRRESRAQRGAGDYRAYAARICGNDTNYYSYVEVPLHCAWASEGDTDRQHNLVLASALAVAGGTGTTLFAIFARAEAPPEQARPSDRSALCLYPLADIDGAIERAREACYSSSNTQDAHVEYHVKSSCTKLPEESTKRYPCGYEHTPSPIASNIPVEAVAALTDSIQLTAVAVASDMNNTILFLGDRLGKLHKVFLRSRSEARMFGSVTIQPGSPINRDLFLDPEGDHVYVLTSTQITKVPVAECSRYSNCTSCLDARDPYCGWCVLD
ncbi:plexin-B1-like, partial [Scyliorhinus torazame]|uniref:plexin-B1-like n=1 Tax=Scyliorhinus torazame TaxID=75743 RepID=UPI003B5C2E70